MIAQVEFLRIPHNNPPTELLVLTAHLDESGQESDQYVVIAGYIGNDDQWTECAKQWRIALGKRKNLHMRELRWNGKKAFRTRLLMERITPVAANCGLIPVAASVKVSDYADLVDDGVLVKRLTQGYVFAAEFVMVAILVWALAKRDRIAVVFEQQDEFSGVVEPICTFLGTAGLFKIPGSDLPILSGVEFVPKSSTILTQLADCLAFATLQDLRDSKSHKAIWTGPVLTKNHMKVSREDMRRIMSSPSYGELKEIGRRFEAMFKKAYETKKQRWREEKAKRVREV